jgi:hypothetical protein
MQAYMITLLAVLEMKLPRNLELVPFEETVFSPLTPAKGKRVLL